MATFRKRNSKWQVQIRLNGHKAKNRTFLRKVDAKRWAHQTEIEIQHGLFADKLEIFNKTTLGDLILRYRDTVTPNKKGKVNETIVLNALLRRSFSQKNLTELSPQDFAKFRDERSRVVRAPTLNHELTYLSHVYRLAKLKWGIPIENPLEGIRRPKADPARARRLLDGEWNLLMVEAANCRNKLIQPIIQLAVETGMRRSEILNIRGGDIDEDNAVLLVTESKNGYSRKIPLTEKALLILSTQSPDIDGRLFPIPFESFSSAWDRLVKRAGIKDLHFHDLRHEAISRFFEMGLRGRFERG